MCKKAGNRTHSDFTVRNNVGSRKDERKPSKKRTTTCRNDDQGNSSSDWSSLPAELGNDSGWMLSRQGKRGQTVCEGVKGLSQMENCKEVLPKQLGVTEGSKGKNQ